MPERADIDKAISEKVRGRSFRQPPDEYGSEIVVSFDVEIVDYDDKRLTLDVYISIDRCEESDQETASILARENWWSEISADLEKRLGLSVETGRIDIAW